MMRHNCHARGCRRSCAPEYLMCPEHWRMVPQKLRLAVWLEYRPGQCDDKRPSPEYIAAANAAIDAVEKKERDAAPQLSLALGRRA